MYISSHFFLLGTHCFSSQMRTRDRPHTQQMYTPNKSKAHLVPVDVVQSVEQHLHNLFDLCQGEFYIGVAQQPCQVVLAEIKHQVDAAFVSVELSSW